MTMLMVAPVDLPKMALFIKRYVQHVEIQIDFPTSEQCFLSS